MSQSLLHTVSTYTFESSYNFLYIGGLYFIVTHTRHLGFEGRVHFPLWR